MACFVEDRKSEAISHWSLVIGWREWGTDNGHWIMENGQWEWIMVWAIDPIVLTGNNFLLPIYLRSPDQELLTMNSCRVGNC